MGTRKLARFIFLAGVATLWSSEFVSVSAQLVRMPSRALAVEFDPSSASRTQSPDAVPIANRPAEVPPGETRLLTSPKGMKYFLRVPKTYQPKTGTRVIVFMHGSNMNGLTYLRSFESAKWAKEDILVCPNGETGGAGADPYGSNNFGFGSAEYVAEITKLVTRDFKSTRVYVGGHSQGGFLTYSVIMLYPDLYHGAFPMAGDCWSQNEPNLWETKPERVALQKRIAIAVIHGQSDPVVAFSQGKHGYDVFRAMGYPKLRLFAPKNLGHQFLLSPVPEALEWLDAMNGLNPVVSLKKTEDWAKEGEWGWVYQTAAAINANKKSPKGAKKIAKKLQKAVEKRAKAATRTIAKRMEAETPRQWLDAWYEYWRHFGSTRSAKPVVKHYASLRSQQRTHGERLFGEARGLFQSNQSDAGYAKLEQLLKEAPMSFHAYYADSWIAAKK